MDVAAIERRGKRGNRHRSIPVRFNQLKVDLDDTRHQRVAY
jgi:hypothetical protein